MTFERSKVRTIRIACGVVNLVEIFIRLVFERTIYDVLLDTSYKEEFKISLICVALDLSKTIF